jgi:hypothetical protein
MTKRSKITLFSLLALVLASGLILTGCPDPNKDNDTTNSGSGTNGGGGITPPTTVTLTAGSPGTAGDRKITDLPNGKMYLVKKPNGKWAKVTAGGLLGDELAELSITGIGVIGNLDGTEITGLTNGATYDVYQLITQVNANNTIGNSKTVDTKARNAMITFQSLNTSTATGVISDAGTTAVKTTLIFLMDDANGVKTGGGLPRGAVSSQVINQGSGSDYKKYTISTATAGTAMLEAVTTGDKYFIVSNINEATRITSIAVAAGD